MSGMRHYAVGLVGSLALGVGIWGCHQNKPDALPSNSSLQTQGEQKVSFTAPENGMVTVKDVRTGDVEWAGDVKKGQSVMVDVDARAISVDGRAVSQDKVIRGNSHQIYFAPTPPTGMTKSSTVDTNTTSVETSHSAN